MDRYNMDRTVTEAAVRTVKCAVTISCTALILIVSAGRVVLIHRMTEMLTSSSSRRMNVIIMTSDMNSLYFGTSLAVQVSTGTSSDCILPPQRRGVPFQNSSWTPSIQRGTPCCFLQPVSGFKADLSNCTQHHACLWSQ